MSKNIVTAFLFLILPVGLSVVLPLPLKMFEFPSQVDKPIASLSLQMGPSIQARNAKLGDGLSTMPASPFDLTQFLIETSRAPGAKRSLVAMPWQFVILSGGSASYVNVPFKLESNQRMTLLYGTIQCFMQTQLTNIVLIRNDLVAMNYKITYQDDIEVTKPFPSATSPAPFQHTLASVLTNSNSVAVAGAGNDNRQFFGTGHFPLMQRIGSGGVIRIGIETDTGLNAEWVCGGEVFGFLE